MGGKSLKRWETSPPKGNDPKQTKTGSSSTSSDVTDNTPLNPAPAQSKDPFQTSVITSVDPQTMAPASPAAPKLTVRQALELAKSQRKALKENLPATPEVAANDIAKLPNEPSPPLVSSALPTGNIPPPPTPVV